MSQGYQSASYSHVGMVRQVNEDACLELAERGLWAVAGQRLIPGFPDAPSSYAFGALGARTWQLVLGTLVGSAPRAFVYTAIGASLDDPTSPLAVAGLVVWGLTAVFGLEVARRAWRTRRTARRIQPG